MSIDNFRISQASEQGICRMCNQLIKQGTIQMTAFGYQAFGRVHIECIKKEVINLKQKIGSLTPQDLNDNALSNI